MDEAAVFEQHEIPTRCECGGDIRDDVIDIAMWTTERGFVIIENVPVRICAACTEQFFPEHTVTAMLRLTTSGYPPERIVREIRVPVYSLTEPGADETVSVTAQSKD